MALRLLEQPPSNMEATMVIDNVNELALASGMIYAESPGDQLVDDELNYLDAFIDSAFREGDENGELIGREIYSELFRLKLGGVAIKNALEVVDDVEEIDSVLSEFLVWQQKMAALLGLVQIMRVLEAEDKERNGEADVTEPDIFGITYETEHHKSIGLHVNDAFLERLGFAPVSVGAEVWYEGETVYLRLQKPAHAPTDLMTAANEDRDEHVHRSELTSIAGRVKRREWLRRTA